MALLLIAAILGIPNGFNNMGNQNLINSVTTSADVGTAIGLYRTIQYIGANLAAVVIELTMRGTIDDAGLHRTGGTIAVIGIAPSGGGGVFTDSAVPLDSAPRPYSSVGRATDF